jgi:lincosamide nucleotidyltransferase A/C/D/E
VDLHPLAFDTSGNGGQELGDRARGLYPAEGLRGSGAVAGRPVRCLTAGLQLSHHLGYPPRRSDQHDLGLLADRFGVPLPPGCARWS